ncbi:MAG: benzoylformate decarboxylase [Actinomycetota bacterium]
MPPALVEIDGGFWEDHLLFCGHPDTAREYTFLKRRLAERFRHDRDAYTEAKTDFICAVVERAREEMPLRPQSARGLGAPVYCLPGREKGRLMATVREVTFDLLRRLGMTTIFGNPGSTELPFLKDFPDDFRYVLALQEASALSMAEGFAQGRGKAAFVNLHTAPGLGNAMGAMVTAWHNKTPLLVTAGQQDRRHSALEPLLTGRLVELAKPYVKRSVEPVRAGDVPREILRAYHTAMQQPRGPVFVSIPMDDWDAEAESVPVRFVSHRPVPDPDALRMVADELKEAENPAIVVGAGVDRAGAFYDAVPLAERLKAPVWQDAISPLAGFPQDHPLFRGHLPAAQRQVAERLSGHDAILVLGAPVFLYYPYVPGPTVEEGTRVLHITDDPQEAARAAVGESVVGDVRAAICALTELLPESGRPMPPVPEKPPVPEPSEPMSVAYVMHAIGEVLPDETAVFDETASSKITLHKYVRQSHPGGYHSSAAGGLGFCMPASVGYKLAVPERPVVCIIGDGSSMYSIQALWTAAQQGVAVPFVVINNSGYSILKGFRDAIGAGEKVPGLDVTGIDFARVAGGLGVEAERIERPDDLRPALERAIAAGRPYLLDVIVDRKVPRLLG